MTCIPVRGVYRERGPEMQVGHPDCRRVARCYQCPCWELACEPLNPEPLSSCYRCDQTIVTTPVKNGPRSNHCASVTILCNTIRKSLSSSTRSSKFVAQKWALEDFCQTRNCASCHGLRPLLRRCCLLFCFLFRGDLLEGLAIPCFPFPPV